MSQADTFIKDIENYFLTLSGKGLMISSKDYYLIKEWMERGLSKEQIFKGIRDAFEQKTEDRIKNIYDCKEHVENSEIKLNKSESIKTDLVESKFYIDKLINNFNQLINKEKHPNLLKLHNKYKSELSKLNADSNNLFEKINKIEEKYFDQFFEYLEQKDKSNLKHEINKAVNRDNSYINEAYKKKVLNIHSKNLIIEKYIYFNPFKTDQ